MSKLVLVDPAGMPHTLPLLGKITNLPGVGEFLLGLNNNFFRKTALTTNFFYDKQLVTPDYFDTVTRHHKIKGMDCLHDGRRHNQRKQPLLLQALYNI